MTWVVVTMALGGLGLLLLGMGMMTDGLKSAAGNKLHQLLERSTQTKFRAAFTGFSITAIVQSSSAVIVATLGFTNAGMLRLKQAAWVVFGSNVGTTMTAWIVALVGLKLKVEIIALPLIGIGMLLQLFMKKSRWAHIGLALAGFGVLFLGLGLLRDGFIDAAEWIPIDRLGTTGWYGILLGVIAGAVLTALIQSSSAALAIILTASVTGVLSPLLGASLVIGANLGTTATSLLASIGATTNARRLALVHLLEKIFTGTIALILLVPLWWISNWLAGGDARTNISTGLALFHTLFNLLGITLMWFLSDHLLRYVERVIKQPELTSEKPRYLDNTVLAMPAMGVPAMHNEIKRVFKQLLARGRKAIDEGAEPAPEEDVNTSALLDAIAEFSNKLGAQGSMEDFSETFLNLNWAREECVQLRILFHELQDTPHEDIEAALTPELKEAFMELLLTGSIKQLNETQRADAIANVKVLRKNRRADLLAQIRSGEITAPEVTRRLQVIALFEESTKRVMRIADIIYPALEPTD